MSLTLENLQNCFSAAHLTETAYVGIKLKLPNKVNELQVIEYGSFNDKFHYYEEVYNENLTLKVNPEVKVVGFTHGNSLDDIAMDLDF